MLRYFDDEEFDILEDALNTYSHEIDECGNVYKLINSKVSDYIIKYFLSKMSNVTTNLAIVYHMNLKVPDLPEALIIPSGHRFEEFFDTYKYQLTSVSALCKDKGLEFIDIIDSHSPTNTQIQKLVDLIIPCIFEGED